MADLLKIKSCKIKLYVKAYPVVPLFNYKILNKRDNVCFHKDNPSSFNYFVGSVKRCDSVIEKVKFLKKCDAFISLGSSFSIEAALVDLPIVHFELQRNQRFQFFEKELFERVDISDHFKYFRKNLKTTNSYSDLINSIFDAALNKKKFSGKKLLSKFGISHLNKKNKYLF